MVSSMESFGVKSKKTPKLTECFARLMIIKFNFYTITWSLIKEATRTKSIL